MEDESPRSAVLRGDFLFTGKRGCEAVVGQWKRPRARRPRVVPEESG